MTKLKVNHPLRELLRTLNSQEFTEVLESIQLVLSNLEEKNDPERIEIEVVGDVSQLLEKIHILKSTLNQHLSKRKELTGDKLQGLYEKNINTFFD